MINPTGPVAAATGDPHDPRDRLARVVTEVFAPAVLIGVMAVLVAWHALDWRLSGLAWGLAGALFLSVIPFGYILRAVHRGQVSGHHIDLRHQRPGPLLFGLCSVVAGVILLTVLGAPRQLLAMAVAVFAGGIVCTAISTVWKLSLHAAVAAATLAGLAVEFGARLALGVPVIALVGWARMRLLRHSLAQVLVGAVAGALVAGFVYAAAR